MVGKARVSCGLAASVLLMGLAARLGQPPTTLAASAADQPSAAASYDAIDRYVEQQLAYLRVPGAALAVVEGDRIVHQRGFGEARPGGGPPSPQTPFAIGSLTKSFTALAVMQLVEAGKVDLDAPVQRYLPWFRVADAEASGQISVRQLLNQTSGFSMAPGLPALADYDTSPGAAERQARALERVRLSQPVGSVWQYSNANYNLLGLVVEAASGESYGSYIQTHIFDPLDMRHSYTARPDAQQDGLAMGYRFWFGWPVADPNQRAGRGFLSSGGLISTTEDLSHYLMAQLNGGRYGANQVLSPAGMAEIQHPAINAASMGLSFGHYGMGWFVDDTQPTRILWHDGNVPDFFGYMALLPGQNQGLVLLLNADHFLMFQLGLLDVGQGAATLLAGGQPQPIWPAVFPWVMRGLLLVPILQIIGVVLTLRRVRRWQRDPHSQPSPARKWALHVALPLVPNLLLAAAPVALLTSSLRNALFLLGPDFSWTGLICGSFAAVWIFVRTGLVLRTPRKSSAGTSRPNALPVAA